MGKGGGGGGGGIESVNSRKLALFNAGFHYPKIRRLAEQNAAVCVLCVRVCVCVCV